jgi:D-alanine transaminase
MPLADVRVSVLDRGFLFGDGIYEVLRVYDGRPFLLREHMARLRRSLAEIRIAADPERLEQRMLATLRESGVQSGLVYMQVTRGAAPRTHKFPQPPVAPNELIYVDAIDVDPYGAYREIGAKLLSIDDVRWRRCDIKSVNLLANCLAAQAAAEAGCLEALLVAADGTITEGSHTSIFAVQHGRILTTLWGRRSCPASRGLGEAGLPRSIPIVEQSLKHADLPAIDEMFLTGTTSEVLPVTQVDGRPIGNGRPGPVTRRLVATYGEYLRDWLTGSGE